MVFKCAKGLFCRLGPAVLEKKLEMLKLEQESNRLEGPSVADDPKSGQRLMEVTMLFRASSLKV